MSEFKTPHPDFAGRIRSSFARQAFVDHIGAELTHVGPGAIDITLGRNSSLAQQYGYVHGGVLASIADSAAGYAALTIAEAGTGVLTTEIKVNFLRPAKGERQIARARVVKPGKTLTICSCDVYDVVAGTEAHVLTGLATIMHVEGLDD